MVMLEQINTEIVLSAVPWSYEKFKYLLFHVKPIHSKTNDTLNLD